MTRATHKLLRKRDQEIATVSFSELLFDLIYVFAVTQLSHYFLHHLTWMGLIQETILWFAVWLGWQHTTWVTNWFNPDARYIRMLLFILMILGLFIASSIPEAFGDRGMVFAISYVTMQIGRTLCVLYILGNNHTLSDNFKRILGWFVISGTFWIVGAFQEGDIRIILWAIAVISDYLSPMFGFWLPLIGRSDPNKEWTVEGHHLIERSQLFVIIAFGETILMTGASLSDMEAWTLPVIYTALLSFVSSLAMWWIYFDSSGEAGREKIQNAKNPGWLGLKYHAVHVVLVGALIYCAVGDELVVHHPFEGVSKVSIFVLIIGPVIYLIANMVYKWMTCHFISKSHIVAIVAYIFIIPFSFKFNLLTLNTLSVLIFVVLAIYETINPKIRKKEIT